MILLSHFFESASIFLIISAKLFPFIVERYILLAKGRSIKFAVTNGISTCMFLLLPALQCILFNLVFQTVFFIATYSAAT